MQIQGLTERDQLLLHFAEVQESHIPSRCPSCNSTRVVEQTCTRGTLCGSSCGGGGFLVSCAACGTTINEYECEEAEES